MKKEGKTFSIVHFPFDICHRREIAQCSLGTESDSLRAMTNIKWKMNNGKWSSSKFTNSPYRDNSWIACHCALLTGNMDRGGSRAGSKSPRSSDALISANRSGSANLRLGLISTTTTDASSSLGSG